MPSGTVREHDNYPLPEDTLFPAKLLKVEQVDIPFTYKKGPKAGQQGTFSKWEWTFQILDGEFAGIEVRGNSEPELTNANEPRGSLKLAKPWYEALIGKELSLEDAWDTDNLIGLQCTITVEHGEPVERKDGKGLFFPLDVADIFPVTAAEFIPF